MPRYTNFKLTDDPMKNQAETQLLNSFENPYDVNYYNQKVLKLPNATAVGSFAIPKQNDIGFQRYLLDTLVKEYQETGKINKYGYNALEALGNSKETDPIFKFHDIIGIPYNQPVKYAKNPNNANYGGY